MDKNKENLQAVLWKKALGYQTSEMIEELCLENGQYLPVKQKITKKDVPPDLAAIKLLMEEYGKDDFDLMSEAELESEKQRLIKLLKEQSQKGEECN